VARDAVNSVQLQLNLLPDWTYISQAYRTGGQGGGSRPPWISETSKIPADGMGNSGIQGTEFF